jgi:alpha-tubulin suppressor-like RCC1 family protein
MGERMLMRLPSKGHRPLRGLRAWAAALSGLLALAVPAVLWPQPASATGSPPLNTYGGLYGWGLNSLQGPSDAGGATGDGTLTNRSTPVPVVGMPDQVSQASHSFNFAVALKIDGTVSTWGSNHSGQLGDPSVVDGRSVPGTVPGLTGITQISTGLFHVLAVDTNGAVWAWGSNILSQVSHDITAPTVPTPLRILGLPPIVQVAAADYGSMALAADGTVWAWGSLLPDGMGPLLHVPGLSGVTQIAAGFRFALALLGDGTVKGWGDNNDGELGIGQASFQDVFPPQVVVKPDLSPLTGVTRIAAGNFHSLAVAGSTSRVWAWGANSGGQLGIGSTTPSAVAVSTSLTDVIQLDGGKAFSAAVRADQTLWTWGSNEDGALGTGSGTNVSVPTQVTSLSNVIGVSAGNTGAHAVVIPRLSVGLPPSTNSVAGQPVNTSLSVSGGTGPYTWSITGLPPGLSGNAAGQIFGTPAPTGWTTWWVTATVTDSFGRSGLRSFTWTNVVLVPYLLGLSESQATSLITGSGLVADVSYTHACVDPGDVLNQNPSGGVAVGAGTTVHITVDSGTLSTCIIL